MAKPTRRLALAALMLGSCGTVPGNGTSENGANAAGPQAEAVLNEEAYADETLRTSPRLPAGFSRQPEEDARREFATGRAIVLDIGMETVNAPGWGEPTDEGRCKGKLEGRPVRELANDVVTDAELEMAGMRYVERFNREMRRLCTSAAP